VFYNFFASVVEILQTQIIQAQTEQNFELPFVSERTRVGHVE
jgi:hypothetical protein